MAIADHCVKKTLATVNADLEVTQAMLNRFNRAMAELTTVVEYLEEKINTLENKVTCRLRYRR